MFQSLFLCLLLTPQDVAPAAVPHEELAVYDAPIVALTADAAAEVVYVVTRDEAATSHLHAFEFTGQEHHWERALAGHPPVVSIGRELIATTDGSNDPVLFVHDRKSGERRGGQGPPMVEQTITALASDPRDRWIWIGTDGGMMTRVIPGNVQQWHRRAMENGGVTAVALDAKVKTLAVAGADGRVRFLNPSSAKRDDKKVFLGGDERLTALAWGPRGRLLVIGDAAGKLVVRSYPSGRRKCDFDGHAAAIRSIVVHPKGKWVATGDADGVVCFWSLKKGEELARLSVPEADSGVVGMLLIDGGRQLVTASGKALLGWPASELVK